MPSPSAESATEGDSFIAAFHTPGSAMAFAEMFQLDLLEVEWPQELLESPLACTVWARVRRHIDQDPASSWPSAIFDFVA